jgi:hypothetical protein
LALRKSRQLSAEMEKNLNRSRKMGNGDNWT